MTPPPPSSPLPPQHNNTTTTNNNDDNNHIYLPSSPSSSSISSGHNSPPKTHITTTTQSHSPPPPPPQPQQQFPSNHLPISAPDSPNRSSISSSDHSLHDINTTNEIDTNDSHTTTPLHELSPHVPSPSPAPVVNRLTRDEPALAVTKLEPHAPTGHAEERGDDVDSRVGGGGGEGGKGSGVRLRVRKEMLSMKRGKKREVMVRRVGLGLRVFEFLSCLVSFSIMAEDRGRGWALDSFDRYLEFRYCISASILGFAFSGFQGLDLAYQLTTRNLKPRQFLRCCFDFTSDQARKTFLPSMIIIYYFYYSARALSA
ncbi:CASP-like protein, partial [Drosera capensis]